ncbi:MAG: molybdenum cofactor guanylyltransferase [Promethearchaeota archaeon]
MSDISIISKYLAVTILIGGKSTRFGSDKGLFQILDKPLISYELETLTQLEYNIFLVAHSIKQVNNYLGKIDIGQLMAFIIDDYSLLDKRNIRTPIIGLYSAFKELNKLGYEKTLVLPCDTPLIQKNVISLLIKESIGYDCCIPLWNNGLFEPLIAIYPIKKALEKSKEMLMGNHYKLTELLVKDWRINHISIENSILPLDPHLLSFFNINNLSELEMFKTKFK